MIARTFSICLFVVALLGSGTYLAEIEPFSAVPVVREKFAWLAAHRDDYDTLFIGTSRIYHGLDPAVFDELTAAAGVPTHSFNFGIDAMTPPEDAYVFERLAALRWKHLRWVVIESGTIRPGVGYGGADNVRAEHWHDTARTLLACRTLLAPANARQPWHRLIFDSASYRHSLPLVGTHAWLWLTRTLNAGRGALLLQSLLRPEPRVHLSTVLGRSRDGFMPAAEGYRINAADRAEYEQLFAGLTAKPSHVAVINRDEQASLDRTLTRVRALGARPVLVTPPNLIKARPYPQPGCTAPVLDYAQIDRWPALFQIDKRVDRAHLNAAGADLFTRAVAADFVELARRSDSFR